MRITRRSAGNVQIIEAEVPSTAGTPLVFAAYFEIVAGMTEPATEDLRKEAERSILRNALDQLQKGQISGAAYTDLGTELLGQAPDRETYRMPDREASTLRELPPAPSSPGTAVSNLAAADALASALGASSAPSRKTGR